MLHKSHKIFIQLSVITLPFLILISIIYGLNTERDQYFNKLKKSTAFINVKSSEPKKIIIPQGMHSSDALRHTSAVGTSENPTIDGGIINAVDGLAVNQPIVNQSLPTPTQPNKLNGEPIQQNSPVVLKFSDEWATSAHVKNILDRAIQTGKLTYVLSQTEEKHLPASVALVPVVESAYKNNAVSPKGAVGSWQLMPNTAFENGIDPIERTQFVPATQAALRLLDQLHHQFGSWELAYAAYNAGPRRVKSALQKNPHATSINELDLPIETKQYVNRLMKINETLIKADSTMEIKNS